jgi:hypothetical protein
VIRIATKRHKRREKRNSSAKVRIAVRAVTVWILLVGMIFSVAVVWGGEAKTSLDMATAYVFRGATFNDGLVFQPGLELSGSPVTLGVWGNFDIDDYDDTLAGGQFSEIDIYGSYDIPFKLDPFGLSVGYTEYTYPSGGGDADREVSLSATADVLMSPSLAMFYGTDGGIKDSTYIELGAGHEMKLSNQAAVEFNVAVGYLEPDEGESGFSHADVAVHLSYGVVHASIICVVQIDDKVLPDVEDNGSYDAQLYGTIGISHSF